MNLQVEAATLTALLLGTVRALGFAVIAPPFAGRSIPMPARAAFVMGLSLALMEQLRDDIPTRVTPLFLITATVTEAAIGLALGFLVYLLFSAVQLAGDLIDVTGGFSLQPAFDPLSMTSSAMIGRLHYLLAVTLLFTSGGHLMLVAGFVRSYTALPIGATLPTEQMASMVATAIGMMFLAAVQIAGPLVAVLLLSDLALALLSRAAPALNVFTLGFPVKIMVTMTLLGLTFPLLPAAVDALVRDALRAMTSLGVGGGG
jgi:flagellar biosynthetic protein FliR